jgi:membrane associated rhomboid family serine protease
MSFIRKPFRYRNDNIVFWLIGINVIIFVLWQFLQRFWHPRFYYILLEYLSMIPVGVMQGRVWTFVTYMFMHGGVMHLLFNMLGLFVFGMPVERYMGSREFLLFYLLTGTLAGIFSFFAYWLLGDFGIALLGASGALFAVELAYAVFFPDSVLYLWGIIPLRAPIMVLGFTALELFFSITGFKSGVAHTTHLAGFAFAWLYFRIRFNIKPWRRLTGR